MSDISEKGSDFFRDLGSAARKNPLSAALIGLGVFWLFTGSRPVERAADFVRRTGFDRIPDAAGNAFEAARSTFRSGAGSIGEHVTSAKDALRDDGADALDSATRFGRDYSDAASDYARSIPGAGAEMFDTARSNLTELIRTRPLALGAIGLAIGAGIAAALPSSEVEVVYLGDTSETVKAKAAEFATEQTARATTLSESVMGNVTEEARKQGLTVEGAKSAVGDFSTRVGRVVDAACKGVSERVTPTKS
ncbi:hypothetical protein IVB18_12155 [Bradyrhizobium sp. 186]|uniref:hypothetical protein n=1 Tax=Bradyrhizobium sp. 186 TaxID=2782654 RepID=UPI002000FD89|nr:hypothetical protein [Bradyrhizobium sp. 186]UPK37975.1 hypothetical protein IVB18_12155 [Bradyrhizobium sp. 186]